MDFLISEISSSPIELLLKRVEVPFQVCHWASVKFAQERLPRLTWFNVAPIAWQIRELEPEGFTLDAIITVVDSINFRGYEDTSYTAKMQAK